MQALSRRSLVSGLLIFASVGTAATAVCAQPQAEIIVPTAPPPPREEVVPVLPSERLERDVWRPGHWQWNGHEYVWVAGHYVERPRRGAVWVPGRWERRPHGWVYIEGHWG
ncbi:YXWGXW repeat-containing protein [Enhydrobacter aerosaccus]|uniref:YXWGXW repeat-containing protein n=1 Tax=Enhydrobacter aerosaccus TaxID=225324 RepID=A0A1T4PQI8_9HYPH|nr:YXWGXW repeat-containing protein [Enhydrobacter aerosaccus]SJZ93805.1 YXWGXW repeat-containing protein [Enhydrobacter aerosaccus]